MFVYNMFNSNDLLLYHSSLGVSQGSNLGTLLFTNNIYSVNNVNYLLYADDFKRYAFINSMVNFKRSY